MRSLIAALRTLVLPYGRTSGTRIVLDGVNGVITIYDAFNSVAGLLTAAGTNGLAEFKLSGPGGSNMALQVVGAGYVRLYFTPGSLVNNTWVEGQIITGIQTGQPYTEWDSPNDAVAGKFSSIQLIGSSNAFPTNSRIIAAADTSIALNAPKATVNGVTPVLANAYNETSTAVTGITTAETVVHSFTASGLTVGNTYEVDWFATWSTDTASCQFQFRARLATTTAGTTMRVFRDITPNANDPAPVYLKTRFVATGTTQGLCVTMVRTSGAGTGQRRGGSDNDLSIMSCREVVNAA